MKTLQTYKHKACLSSIQYALKSLISDCYKNRLKLPYQPDFWEKRVLRYPEIFFLAFSHRFSYGKRVIFAIFKGIFKIVSI